VEEEVFVLCHPEAMDLTDMASRHPIIRLIINLPVCTHSMVPFLAQAAVASHGVEVVAGYSVAGEGFVGGSGKEWVAWGPLMELGGSAISKGQLNLPWRLTNDRSPLPVIVTNSLKKR